MRSRGWSVQQREHGAPVMRRKQQPGCAGGESAIRPSACAQHGLLFTPTGVVPTILSQLLTWCLVLDEGQLGRKPVSSRLPP